MFSSLTRFSAVLLLAATLAPAYVDKPSVGLDVNIVATPADPKPGETFDAVLHYTVSPQLGTVSSLRVSALPAKTAGGVVCATVVNGGDGARMANVKPGQYMVAARYKLVSNDQPCTVVFEALTRENPKTLAKERSLYSHTLHDRH